MSGDDPRLAGVIPTQPHDERRHIVRARCEERCSPTWRHGSAEGYVCTFGGNGRTAPTASRNCGTVACRSSTRRLPPARRPGSGACRDTRRSNRPCATPFSIPSVSPGSLFLPQLNSIEPPWYGPVCPVVWEGWHREVSPYPDQRPLCYTINMTFCQLGNVIPISAHAT